MPQLVKGGKWVFGWAVVGSQGELTIPPQAWREYGFRTGDEAVFMPGSRRSGGFGLSTPRLVAAFPEPLRAQERVLGRARFDEGGRVTVPPEVGVKPGDRLLTVRGSGRALGFVARGPIFEEALRHPELQVFE
jgi:hypothetical protein